MVYVNLLYKFSFLTISLLDTAKRILYNSCVIRENKAVKSKQEGWEKGRKEGRKEGKEEGRTEGKLEFALELLKDGMSLEKVAKYSKLSLSMIQELAKQNKLI